MGQVAGALLAPAFSPRPTLSWGTAPCRRLPQSRPHKLPVWPPAAPQPDRGPQMQKPQEVGPSSWGLTAYEFLTPLWRPHSGRNAREGVSLLGMNADDPLAYSASSCHMLLSGGRSWPPPVFVVSLLQHVQPSPPHR